MSTVLRIALVLALALPASAHLLHRGTPLSELAASSPLAVVGRVAATGPETVELVVEEAVLGHVAPGPLHFALQGHHPPDYAPGARVLVFLAGDAPPFVSRQTSLDRVDVPERASERAALLEAVRGYAQLRSLPGAAERLARLQDVSLAQLGSPSPRLRHEALLDLVAIAGRTHFEPPEVERLAALARSGQTPDTLAPGLVVLLAAIRQPEAEAALLSLVKDGKQPQARARAAEVIAKRHGAAAAPALRRMLDDPAPVVSATARHFLARLEPATPAGQMALDSQTSIPREGKQDAVPHADPD